MTDRLTVCQKGEDMWLEGLESMTSATFPKNRRQSATLLDLNLLSPFEIVFKILTKEGQNTEKEK